MQKINLCHVLRSKLLDIKPVVVDFIVSLIATVEVVTAVGSDFFGIIA